MSFFTSSSIKYRRWIADQMEWFRPFHNHYDNDDGGDDEDELIIPHQNQIIDIKELRKSKKKRMKDTPRSIIFSYTFSLLVILSSILLSTIDARRPGKLPFSFSLCQSFSRQSFKILSSTQSNNSLSFLLNQKRDSNSMAKFILTNLFIQLS